MKSESIDLASEVKALSKLSVRKSMEALFFDWVLIFLAGAASLRYPGPLVYILAIIIIAGRQHGLFVLMHEGAHYRLFNSTKLNNFVSDAFIALPVIVRTNAYRENHLQHHRHLNTDLDPDWRRKSVHPEWQFPKTKAQLLWIFGRYLLGFGFIEFYHAAPILLGINKRSGFPFLIAAYYAVVLGAVWYFLGPKIFFMYWFIPYFLVLPIFMRVRSVAEHFGVENTCDYNKTRNIFGAPLSRLLVGPHNVAIHLDHHLFPSVPFYNLSQLHKVLMQVPAYQKDAHINGSYWGVQPSLFADLIKSEMNDLVGRAT